MTGSSKQDDETETVRMIPSIHTYMHVWVYIEAVLVTYLYRTKITKKIKINKCQLNYMQIGIHSHQSICLFLVLRV